MAAMQIGVRFDKIAEKWHALAQRRLAYIRELERSGRWKRYYKEELYGSCLREAERAVMLWSKLATARPMRDPNTDDVRPAA
ncbi:MAG TPA: TIGR03809 family protein [Pseudolabrys sp.]|nr:TIGR03809 family protein [Pseudolabrys sp.]